MLKCTQYTCMCIFVHVFYVYMVVYESILYDNRAKEIIANISGVFET